GRRLHVAADLGAGARALFRRAPRGAWARDPGAVPTRSASGLPGRDRSLVRLDAVRACSVERRCPGRVLRDADGADAAGGAGPDGGLPGIRLVCDEDPEPATADSRPNGLPHL